MTQADELLTPKETAAFLKVHERTVRRWIKDGKVPCVRIGVFGTRLCCRFTSVVPQCW